MTCEACSGPCLCLCNYHPPTSSMSATLSLLCTFSSLTLGSFCARDPSVPPAIIRLPFRNATWWSPVDANGMLPSEAFISHFRAWSTESEWPMNDTGSALCQPFRPCGANQLHETSHTAKSSSSFTGAQQTLAFVDIHAGAPWCRDGERFVDYFMNRDRTERASRNCWWTWTRSPCPGSSPMVAIYLQTTASVAVQGFTRCTWLTWPLAICLGCGFPRLPQTPAW